jgi:hypothetical protein
VCFINPDGNSSPLRLAESEDSLPNFVEKSAIPDSCQSRMDASTKEHFSVWASSNRGTHPRAIIRELTQGARCFKYEC